MRPPPRPRLPFRPLELLNSQGRRPLPPFSVPSGKGKRLGGEDAGSSCPGCFYEAFSSFEGPLTCPKFLSYRFL